MAGLDVAGHADFADLENVALLIQHETLIETRDFEAEHTVDLADEGPCEPDADV